MKTVEVSKVIASHWNITGEVTELPGERDLNFLISGEIKYIAKVYDASIEGIADWLSLQDRALEYLTENGALNVPKILRPHSDSNTSTLSHSENGKNYLVRVLTWVDGEPWAKRSDHTPDEIEELGALVGAVDRALKELPLSSKDFAQLHRTFMWNMMQAENLVPSIPLIKDGEIRAIATEVLNRFIKEVKPELNQMPAQLIHNDANDYNIIENQQGSHLIDFGDVISAPKIVGVAVACAYLACASEDPTKEITHFLRGYHRASPLTPDDVRLLFDLIQIRLISSVINAAIQQAAQPDNEYLGISQSVVPVALQKLAAFDRHHAHFRFRDAIGLEANPHSKAIRDFLLTRENIADVVAPPFKSAKKTYINWSFDNPDIPRTTQAINTLMAETGADITIGYYCENRNVYEGEAFNFTSPSARTFHLGVDLGAPAGSPVYAPLDGVIELFNDNATYLDYGPVVILRHETDTKIPFWTLYGHLSKDSMPAWQIGKTIKAGELIGRMGTEEENVGWPPHTHFQLLTDLCGMGIDIYGVAPRDEVSLWRGISLNPNLILGIETGTDAHAKISKSEIRQKRKVTLSNNLSLNFKSPLHIVRGEGAYLYDESGRPYLDLVNNVAHVGHAHPRVVEAAQRQMSTLNTNTRFLHQTIIEYGKALTSSLPDPLSVIFFVNSGSEANDLAIRLARAHTKARGVISLRHGYHGHTQSVIEISPYKFLGKGGLGKPDHVGVAELPDPFRGVFRGKDSAPKYLSNLDEVISGLSEPLSAFFAESIVSTAGQITLPAGYLQAAYQRIRKAGGLCVSDEVQIGLGRVGEKFWGFELHGVVPDIVTMGKPLGNGHPLAAVATTAEIARSFHNGMEYFNTFGGNPVSATIGQTVLEIVYDQRLQSNAEVMGRYLQDGVRALQSSHSIIADVRGHGLFIGVEFMRDANTPATREVAELMEFALTRGVMLSCDGPDNNVLKIKPPMIITREDVDLFLATLKDWLNSL